MDANVVAAPIDVAAAHIVKPAAPTTTSKKVAIAKPILAGALTGALEAFITYPTEYVKTHLQLQDKHAPRKYNGILDCVAKTVSEAGFRGLYRGASPIIVGSVPKQASRWGAYEWACDSLVAFHNGNASEADARRRAGGGGGFARKHLSVVEISACGFVAGGAEALIAVVPTETVKTQLISDARSPQPRYARLSLPRAVAAMLRDEGIRGVYRGVSNTVIKQALNQSMRFPAQMGAMHVFCGGSVVVAKQQPQQQVLRYEHRRKSPLWNGLAGFAAGIFSVFITQPVDVIKTKMQGRESAARFGNSSLRCWQHVLRHDGFGHLYAGSVARMLRVGSNVALTFTLFPLIKELL